jgi:hypothetical protein
MADEEACNTYEAWTPTQVANWLSSINASFKECGPLALGLKVDGASLNELVNNNEELEKIGITKEIQCCMIRKAFKKLSTEKKDKRTGVQS